MKGRVILTAGEMRAAEARSIAAGTSVETLMERAGQAAAAAIRRFAGPMPALVLCGPGNNGGDGYVVARALAAAGQDVRVAAAGEPRTPAAKAARAAWGGEVHDIADVEPAPLLIDSLFGTGLTRGLERDVAAALEALAGMARITAAIDLPSGVSTDDGAILSPVPDCDLAVTFQTLKPAHLLQPAARHMGRIVVADIGIEAASDLHEIARPRLAAVHWWQLKKITAHYYLDTAKRLVLAAHKAASFIHHVQPVVVQHGNLIYYQRVGFLDDLAPPLGHVFHEALRQIVQHAYSRPRMDSRAAQMRRSQAGSRRH